MSVKGLIFNIQQFSINDGPGIRTTIFLKGCPLECWWCHNPESRSGKIEFHEGEEIGKYYSVEELLPILLKDQIFFEESGGGVTFSGGEPLQQSDFLIEILKSCKEEGIHTAVDTTGFSDLKIIKEISELTDLFLFDLKIIDPVKHKFFTGVSNNKILSNLEFLIQKQNNLVIRIPLIPDITVTNQNLAEIFKWLNRFETKNEINLLPYHRIADHKYERYGMKNKMKGKKVLTQNEIQHCKQLFEERDYKVKIGG